MIQARKRLRKALKDVTTVQSVARGHLARQKIKKAQRAASVIQGAYRTHLAEKEGNTLMANIAKDNSIAKHLVLQQQRKMRAATEALKAHAEKKAHDRELIASFQKRWQVNRASTALQKLRWHALAQKHRRAELGEKLTQNMFMQLDAVTPQLLAAAKQTVTQDSKLMDAAVLLLQVVW